MRTKNQVFVPYHVALEIMKGVPVGTRAEYWKWYEVERPLYLPKHPNKAYEEWEGWNAFFRNTNSFEKTLERNKGEVRVYRQYWDAVRWAQAYAKERGISSRREWFAEFDDSVIPSDIPKWPDRIYEGFSWVVWLGKTVVTRVESASAVVVVMSLHNVVGGSSNEVVMRVWREGYGSLELCDDSGIGKALRVYEVEGEGDIELMLSILGMCGSLQYDVYTLSVTCMSYYMS